MHKERIIFGKLIVNYSGILKQGVLNYEIITPDISLFDFQHEVHLKSIGLTMGVMILTDPNGDERIARNWKSHVAFQRNLEPVQFPFTNDTVSGGRVNLSNHSPDAYFPEPVVCDRLAFASVNIECEEIIPITAIAGSMPVFVRFHYLEM